MNDVHPCRSVAEAHLFLDLLGAAKDNRRQRLEARGDDLVSVYTVQLDGQDVEIRFTVADEPLIDGFGGPEPSRIVDPGQWLLHADRLSSSVPADPGAVEPGKHGVVQRRLEEAARCIDEIVKFVPPGEESVPHAAFFTPIGKVTFLKEPGRFRKSRLEAVAKTYRDIARRFVH